MNSQKGSLKTQNLIHPLYIKEMDVHNSEVAKYVALAVALFHIPLFALDIYRMIYDKNLFSQPGFGEITLVHAIYLIIFTALYVSGVFLLKKNNKNDEFSKGLKIYWRLFLYSTLTYAMFSSPLCHLMHGNTTTYFVTVMGMSSAMRVDKKEFLLYLTTLGIITLFMIHGIETNREIFTGYILDFFTVSVIAIFISSFVNRKALATFYYRKNFEREQAANIISKEAGRAKTIFLANMSHEIRTPLSGIKGILSLLEGSELNETQKEYLAQAEKSSDILIDIVDDLLDMSIIDSGNVVIEEESFNFKQTLETVLTNIKKGANHKDISLTSSLDKRMPDLIIGDPLRISQVITNLLSNAVKFTEKGSIAVKAEIITKELRNEKMLSFEVKDSGPGINPENIEKLFESFYQNDSSFRKKFKGAGLGLSISKKLVERMGGEIYAGNNPDKGAVFRFEIPLKIPDTDDKVVAEPDSEAPLTLKNLKILLVEDNVINRELLVRFLTNENGAVTTAENGVEAVAKYKSGYFDVVLMDIQMPVMDGVEAVKHIREYDKERKRHTPVIALTAYAMKGDRQRFINEGMDSYLSKPVKKEVLVKEIIDTIRNVSGQ
jgi:signal transduction histidine kinase/ActR/RegA family two-component response regulator